MTQPKIFILFLLSSAVLSTMTWADNIPKLVDVGADKCIPCIKMAPILDKLREDFSGRMEVIFIDAWKNKDGAAEYGVRMIPTQIFYAPDGTELYRHTGFYGRAEILDKWQQLGYEFSADNR